MFTVKATYRNETRKFTFDSVLFPTYNELNHQLRRIFPINHTHYLSNLIFSPDAPKPGRILIGKEVHSAEDYDLRVAPLRRLWPNPLLRFTVCDETSYKASSRSSERSLLYGALPIPPSPVPHRHNGLLNPHSPPPQIRILPSPPPPSLFSTPTKSCSPHRGTVPCCPIAKGKADIQVLLSSFKEDLDCILSRTFGTSCAENTTTSSSIGHAIPPQSETPVCTAVNTTSQWCFVCKTSFAGVWYGCIKCPWHAVCSSCFSKSHGAHTLSFGPSHVVQQHSTDRFAQDSAQVVGEIVHHDSISETPESPTLGAASEPALSVHRGVICDSCNETIVGIRHKCLDCPDYDLCTDCVQSGATEEHNPFHQFFDIEIPGRVHVHTVFGGDGNRSSSFDLAPATQHSPAPTFPDQPVAHCATCNLCDSVIVGERYKCVICPDFDTCSSCFRITTEQHPIHGFVKVNRPGDLIMRDTPLRHAAHLAVCDSCRKTVHGARYKCMHPGCPDFDLCSDCEALPIPVHPPNHPMLKLKTSDTVIPTVYRVGQTQTIGELPGPRSAPAHVESGSPLSHSPLATPPELEPAAVSGQATNILAEDQMPFTEEFLSPLGSPQGEVLGVSPTSATIAPSRPLIEVTGSPGPQSIHTALDIYRQLNPRVAQEMMELGALEDRVGDLVGNHVEDAGPEESLPGTPAALDERHVSYPASSIPSTKSIVDGYRTPSSTPSNVQESHCFVQRFPTGDQQEVVMTNLPDRGRLDSVLMGDTNVPDGQVFPPGAEFVKGWHMMNSGELPWPATTEIQFVAGEMFASNSSVGLRENVGVVHPGRDLDVWTGDLKAPDVPGRYVGYWRLNDGHGNFFGTGVWIDLTVADHSDPASEQSLAASSMIMPSAHPTNACEELPDAPHPSLPSTRTMSDEVGGPESDISSVSLVSVPTSDDEDAEWQDTRTHSEPLEYVVLYNGTSEE